ncbi:PREDICTED: solute carrier family 22 member 7-like [Nanorana parkeri]|uniref:solute carrier family 22 member 7-like n=1 Tax=Nanorana parkeri TaxID=125878 RepID=UPI00085484DF|nr:PREDICTED: solute carrier family 22 member 7-like [Nanorana parkeri]
MGSLSRSSVTVTAPRKMTFDDLLIEAGGFGRFQVIVLLILCIPRLIIPLHFLQHVFISAVPPHHCAISTQRNPGNLSQEDLLFINIPQEQDGTFSSCKMYSQPQPYLILNRSQETVNGSGVQSCDQGWEYDLSTISSTTVTQWDLVCSRRGLSKAVATIFFIGVTLGAVIFGYLSDRYGRRVMILVSIFLAMAFGGLSAGSISYPMLAVSMALSGSVFAGLSNNIIALSVEWVDVRHRTDATIITGFCWSIGSCVLALLAYLLRDWRWLTVAINAPLFLAIITIWWIPESARWLLTKGRAKKAEAVLMRCAAVNGCNLDAFRKNSESIQALAEAGPSSQTYSYIDLFRTPRLRRISLCSGLVWFAVAFSYYGIILGVSGFGFDLYLTHFLYSLVEFPGKLAMYFLMNHIGRRWSLFLTMLMTGVCIGVSAGTPLSLAPFRTAVAIIGKGFSEAAFTGLILYTAELYPTVIRQNGIGYTSFVGRIGASVAPLMLLLDDIWHLLPKTIFCVTAVACSLVAGLLPETINVPLPETIQDVESKRDSKQLKNGDTPLTELPPRSTG